MQNVSPEPPPPVVVPAPPLTRLQLALIGSVLALMLFVSIGVVTQLLNLAFGLWWSELFIFFAVPYVGLKLTGRSPLKAAGLRTPWVSGAVFGFALGVTNFFAAAAPLMFISQKLAPAKLLELYDAAKVFQDKGPIELVFIVLGVCIAAPLCEEMFFRGLVQPGLNEFMSAPLAIIATGWVFSAFHLDPVGFLARWELGIVFGILAWRTGSLWPGIFLHLANNLTSTVLYFATRGQQADPTDDVKTIALISGVGGLLLLTVVLVGRRFPSVFTAPQRLEEVRVTPRPARMLGLLAAAALLSIVALLVVDFRGSMVTAIDAVFPVKSPSAELNTRRDQALNGEMSIRAYGKIRGNANKPDAPRKTVDTRKTDDTRNADDAVKADDALNLDDTRKSANTRKTDDALNLDDTRKPDETREPDAG